jgi:hypothetical protein
MDGDTGEGAALVRAGDLVVTASPVQPVGKVERALETSRGLRLLVERAFAPRSYVVLPGEDVLAVETEAATGLRWVVSRLGPAALLGAGAYRRELGHLRPDPFPGAPGAPGAPAGPPALDDGAARRALAAALRADPLIAGEGGSEVTVRVRHGVAVLEGWVRTVAAKVQAYRLARAVPGIWEARSRLASDEETRVCVGDALRARPDLAESVDGVEVDLGAVVVRLQPGASPAVIAGILEAARAAPGVRTVAASPATAG